MLSFLLSFTFCYGQTDQGENHYYDWFDRLSGIENTGLYNGIGYVEKYRVINGYHKFFSSSDFQSGSIIYKGQPYFNLKMKYDLDEDRALVSLDSGLGIVFLEPIKSWVDGFTIGRHKFVQLREKETLGEIPSGFYELLAESLSLKLFRKHKKKRFRRTKRKVVYYEFKSRNKTILYYNKGYYAVKVRKDFLNIFPEYKTEIKSYYKKSVKNYDRTQAMIALVERISVLLRTSNNQIKE